MSKQHCTEAAACAIQLPDARAQRHDWRSQCLRVVLHRGAVGRPRAPRCLSRAPRPQDGALHPVRNVRATFQCHHGATCPSRIVVQKESGGAATVVFCRVTRACPPARQRIAPVNILALHLAMDGATPLVRAMHVFSYLNCPYHSHSAAVKALRTALTRLLHGASDGRATASAMRSSTWSLRGGCGVAQPPLPVAAHPGDVPSSCTLARHTNQGGAPSVARSASPEAPSPQPTMTPLQASRVLMRLRQLPSYSGSPAVRTVAAAVAETAIHTQRPHGACARLDSGVLGVRRISFWRIAGLRHVALLQQRPRLRHGHDPGAGVRPGHLRVGVDHTCVVSCDARAPSTAGTAHCWWSLLENPRGASRRWLLKGSVSLALCLSVAVRYCVYTQGSPCHILPNNINNVVNHLVISDHTAPQLPGQCTLPTCHLRKPEVAASW